MKGIKDIKFELDTGFTGTAEYITPLINGKLEAVIVNIPNGCLDLGLYFEDMYDVCLLEKLQLKGQQYIPIRVDTISDDGQKFNFNQDKYALNNKLYCIVEGNYSIKAIITLRYSTNPD